MTDRLEVEVRYIEARTIMSAATTVPGTTWGPAYGPLLAEIFEHLTRHQASATGPPIARFAVRTDHVLLEASVPVTAQLEGEGRVRRAELPGGKAAVATHVGPYRTLGNVHTALRAWVEEHGHRLSGPFWEVYLTDPDAEPDESRWRTEVVYLLST